MFAGVQELCFEFKDKTDFVGKIKSIAEARFLELIII
jgi:hypothetical protein